MNNWEWQDESRQDIRFIDSNIVLNVSAYSMENLRANVIRLSPDPSGDSDSPNQQVSVVAYGAEQAIVQKFFVRKDYLSVAVQIEEKISIHIFQA